MMDRRELGKRQITRLQSSLKSILSANFGMSTKDNYFTYYVLKMHLNIQKICNKSRKKFGFLAVISQTSLVKFSQKIEFYGKIIHLICLADEMDGRRLAWPSAWKIF